MTTVDFSSQAGPMNDSTIEDHAAAKVCGRGDEARRGDYRGRLDHRAPLDRGLLMDQDPRRLLKTGQVQRRGKPLDEVR
ncbi:MAG: hypothetical protein E6K40_18470 [Gammaproteobacteria bacterium]|nr:MAG: hypothetical protein E6K40_18470 [Gammaproteobacteria bacterium]